MNMQELLSFELMRVAKNSLGAPEQDSRSLAEQAVSKIKTAHLRELAIREVQSWIEHYRRVAAKEVEKAATEPTAVATGNSHSNRGRKPAPLSGEVTSDNFMSFLDPT